MKLIVIGSKPIDVKALKQAITDNDIKSGVTFIDIEPSQSLEEQAIEIYKQLNDLSNKVIILDVSSDTANTLLLNDTKLEQLPIHMASLKSIAYSGSMYDDSIAVEQPKHKRKRIHRNHPLPVRSSSSPTKSTIRFIKRKTP